MITTLKCCLLVVICSAGLARASISTPDVPVASRHPDPLPAPGMFLVARRDFADPFFARTVVWLLQHDEHATFGLVINRQPERTLSEAVAAVRDSWLQALPVFHGGPVDPDMLVMLVRGPVAPEISRHVTADVHASIHGQLLNELLLEPRPASRVRFFLGHAGWVPGQLEAEISRGNWRVLEGDVELVFGSDTAGLWKTLIERVEPAAVTDKP